MLYLNLVLRPKTVWLGSRILVQIPGRQYYIKIHSLSLAFKSTHNENMTGPACLLSINFYINSVIDFFLPYEQHQWPLKTQPINRKKLIYINTKLLK